MPGNELKRILERVKDLEDFALYREKLKAQKFTSAIALINNILAQSNVRDKNLRAELEIYLLEPIKANQTEAAKKALKIRGSIKVSPYEPQTGLAAPQDPPFDIAAEEKKARKIAKMEENLFSEIIQYTNQKKWRAMLGAVNQLMLKLKDHGISDDVIAQKKSRFLEPLAEAIRAGDLSAINVMKERTDKTLRNYSREFKEKNGQRAVKDFIKTLRDDDLDGALKSGEPIDDRSNKKRKSEQSIEGNTEEVDIMQAPLSLSPKQIFLDKLFGEEKNLYKTLNQLPVGNKLANELEQTLLQAREYGCLNEVLKTYALPGGKTLAEFCFSLNDTYKNISYNLAIVKVLNKFYSEEDFTSVNKDSIASHINVLGQRLPAEETDNLKKVFHLYPTSFAREMTLTPPAIDNVTSGLAPAKAVKTILEPSESEVRKRAKFITTGDVLEASEGSRERSEEAPYSSAMIKASSKGAIQER